MPLIKENFSQKDRKTQADCHTYKVRKTLTDRAGLAARVLVLIVLIGLFLAFLKSGVLSHLNFAGIKELQFQVEDFYQKHPYLTPFIYFVVFVLSITVAIPGATLLTVLSGALFGLWGGLWISCFASTIGATFSFWAARFLFRDWVQEKFPVWVERVDRGVARDGAYYLFFLRLFPTVALFAVNLSMGLTAISSLLYMTITFVGMIPIISLYVYAGTRLSQMQSPRDLLDYRFAVSLILVGLIPLAIKKFKNIRYSSPK